MENTMEIASMSVNQLDWFTVKGLNTENLI